MKAIEVEGLTVSYEKSAILWDVTFSIPKGVLCGIAGPNGAGKSTLLKAAIGLVRPISGRIDFFGKPFSQMQRKIAYVPQRELVDWDFPITAFDVVLMGRYHRFGWFGRPKMADRDAASRALEQVGMSAFAHCQINQLSGGQQQRIFIARALVQDPDLLLLDEPFSGIDQTTEQEIVDLLKRLKMAGKTILIVFHDLHNAQNTFDWLLLLNRRLIACGPTEQIYSQEMLQKAFGKGDLLFEEATALSAKVHSGLVR